MVRAVQARSPRHAPSVPHLVVACVFVALANSASSLYDWGHQLMAFAGGVGRPVAVEHVEFLEPGISPVAPALPSADVADRRRGAGDAG